MTKTRERWTIVPCIETDTWEDGIPPILDPVKSDAAASWAEAAAARSASWAVRAAASWAEAAAAAAAEAAADVFVVRCNGEYVEQFRTRAEAEACVRDMKGI